MAEQAFKVTEYTVAGEMQEPPLSGNKRPTRRLTRRSKSFDDSPSLPQRRRSPVRSGGRRRPPRRNSFSHETPSKSHNSDSDGSDKPLHNAYSSKRKKNDDSDSDDSDSASSESTDDANRRGKLQQLKTFFSNSEKKLKRKPVLRQYSGHDSVASTLTSDISIDILENRPTPSRNSSNNNLSSAMLMMHQSTVTLPITNGIKSVNESDRQRNYTMKTDQIIESLVWFSFHIPRTVLEDLISHELTVWKREQQQNLFPATAHQDNSQHTATTTTSILQGNFSENMQRLKQDGKQGDFIKLPCSVERESALLFCDMSGFTKLSTMLDAESLSKVINAYFDMIVSEVIQHGGDILKFAGDAFFAEWSVNQEEDEDDDDTNGDNDSAAATTTNPLADLNASLMEFAWDDNSTSDNIPKISTCAMRAARCAQAIVSKYSDYHVTTSPNAANTSSDTQAMLNVHCGLGVGSLVGLHVGDYKEDQHEDHATVEMRREFLILGDPIDQVGVVILNSV